ncbi:MAG TPA: DUF1820 family protein [Steroidobacteraceae bacterium]|nr:DUF1820 family protein [Steroidobacteraceae bacterium]
MTMGIYSPRFHFYSLEYTPNLTIPLKFNMAASHIFRVVFANQGKVYEIYARKVSHGALWGFVEVEELVFGEKSSVVVDPAEERVKAEFEGVKRTYLPMHSVLRIDEVRKHGISKVTAADASNVTQFPAPIYTPEPKR